MNFSQRMGIEPATKPLQLDSMDKDLRISLWNTFSTFILSNLAGSERKIIARKQFGLILWYNFFKWKVESIPEDFSSFKQVLDNWFFASSTPWNKIYHFIEFIDGNIELTIGLQEKAEFEQAINFILEREFSAYRFINNVLAPISNEHEKAEIETAIQTAANFTALAGCNLHLSQALKLLSDKVKPDYRNSIKESISAVETAIKVFAENKKIDFSKAMAILKVKANINGGLAAGMNSIYGWTSNDSGIRHGLMDEPNCDFDDAKYMLVSCSAFINYLISKAQKAGVSLGKDA